MDPGDLIVRDWPLSGPTGHIESIAIQIDQRFPSLLIHGCVRDIWNLGAGRGETGRVERLQPRR
jgi:hypothetical protein